MTEAKLTNQQLIKRLLLIVLGMFGFGFALVPLYNVFCEITGINGKTNTEAATYQANHIDTSRSIKVQFITRTSSGLAWAFEPMVSEVNLHPGEMKLVKFYAKNNADKHIIGQAIPSVSPGLAANYLHKIECFCFNQQPLEARQAVEMPVQFYLDESIPNDIHTLTLSYTLYDVTDKFKS